MPEKIFSAVIVFTEKDRKYLKNCLKSLERSASVGGLRIEFILFANSTDHINTGFLKSEVKKLTSKEKLGFGRAVNKAMKYVKRDWCFLVCPDVITGSMTIAEILPETSPKNAIIAPKIIFPDGHVQPTILSLPGLYNIFIEQSYLYKLFPSIFKSPQNFGRIYAGKNSVEAIAAIWWLINVSSFRKAGGFDERFFLYFEDVDLCIRLKNLGYSLFYQPEAEAKHIPHQSTGGETRGDLYFQSLIKILKKYHSQFSVSLAASIFLSGSLIRLIYWIVLKYLNKSLLSKADKKIIFLKACLKKSLS